MCAERDNRNAFGRGMRKKLITHDVQCGTEKNDWCGEFVPCLLNLCATLIDNQDMNCKIHALPRIPSKSHSQDKKLVKKSRLSSPLLTLSYSPYCSESS